MAGKSRKYQGFGTIAAVKRVLWQILQQAATGVADATLADEARRGWANTGIQAALAYSRVHETHVLEPDMEAMARASAGHGHAA